jgi:DNA adenine methylase
MKPLLKWVGGKTQILPAVLSEFPRSMDSYHEPFLGGGSVLLGLLSSTIEVRGSIHASDVNPALINVYVAVRDSPNELIACLRELETTAEPEPFYYEMRTRFNAFEPKHGPQYAAMFVFLNKTCFRGVYREGPHGFNVPFGHYKAAFKTPATEILEMSPLLQRVQFHCQSFEDSLAAAGPGDFVYLDPPYVPKEATSFVGYVAGGFRKHAELFAATNALPCGFVMSNADVSLVRDAFIGCNVKSITCRRAIHSQDPSSTAQEVLITKSA